MERVVEVDALVVARCRGRRASLHRVGAVEHDEARLRLRAAPARAACASGTPFHLPMQLQPSTQSWRVICVRDGSARSSASENAAGFSTRPPTFSCQSAKPFCAQRDVVGVVAARACRWRGIPATTSASVNSCASAVRGATAAARARLRLLALFSMSRSHVVCDSRSQPVSSAEPAAGDRAAQQMRRSRWRAASALGLASWPASSRRLGRHACTSR